MVSEQPGSHRGSGATKHPDNHRLVEAGASRPALKHLHMGFASEQGKRPSMEDFCVALPHMVSSSSGLVNAHDTPCSYAAIFDGHKSVFAAKLASTRLHEHLAQDPNVYGFNTDVWKTGHWDGSEKDPIVRAIKNAFEAVDTEIVQNIEDGLQGDCGSTASITLRFGQSMYVAHAGDSGAVMARGEQAFRLTIDHKANVPRERERIEGTDLTISRRGNVVAEDGRNTLAMSRALGDTMFKPAVVATPEVLRVDLQPEDWCVIIGSDGLWDVMRDAEAVAVVSGVVEKVRRASGFRELDTRVAQMAAEALVTRAIKWGTSDNTSAVVQLLEWEGGPEL